ncbi:MFS transporter [Agrococcus jejuensis]|uniref:Predicted arabinose efflux permease, MFS family n=1 Tax=Agrococcus jejuensis TaxID=399736 RepID=A0A1G8GCW8_9MICO|nr:MFS transporter [Agrococcus jejuensis]SDH92141.1 Predicted arabinose efflux permease, MFS family [Agrococcus jejuensis]
MSDAERFPFKKVAVAAYLPTILFAIGEGAIIPYIPVIAGDLGASLAVAGLVAAMMTVGELAGSVPGGMLVGRLGERATMIYAGLATILALSLAWFATEPWMLGLAILVTGVATAIFALARHAFMTTYVPYRYRARALSALGGTFRLGLFIGPLLASGIIALGAPVQVTIWLFVGGCLAAVVVLFFLPDPQSTFESGKGHEGAETVERETVRLGDTLRRYAKTLGTVGVGAAMLALARKGRDVIIPLWAVSIGVDAATTGLIVGIAGAVDFLLFFVSGLVMDRFGRLWAVVPSLILMGAGFATLAATHDGTAALVGLLVGAGLLAVANGMSSGILMTLGADLADRMNPAPFLGAWRLTTNAGGAIAPLGVAALIQASSIVTAGFALVATCAIGVVVLVKTLPRGKPGG